ncbi:hypothetical protein SNA_13650 [Streptomyces natalensis ATCC 27448]|uniref:Uncharacterized protein n=1 Tax=Streptomyces natalensis ATCC 27448 TaxID=1240678 RepID=A0A0D7CMS4_9ACTN|nr:hypothetical protein SNA_13650 [Streptomyces natalensis ATCC 27448]
MRVAASMSRGVARMLELTYSLNCGPHEGRTPGTPARWKITSASMRSGSMAHVRRSAVMCM